jgi:nitroreductase
MEFAEVRRRRMIRHYQDRPIEAKVVARIVANALRAPSGGFTRGWGFLVLTDRSGLSPLAATEDGA